MLAKMLINNNPLTLVNNPLTPVSNLVCMSTIPYACPVLYLVV